jgi:hypothetical protein
MVTTRRRRGVEPATETPHPIQGEAESNSHTADQTTPNDDDPTQRRSSDGEAEDELQEKIHRARRTLKNLKRERELRMLESEIAKFQRLGSDVETWGQNTSLAEDTTEAMTERSATSRATPASRANGSEDERPIQPEKLPKYTGKSVREHRNWVQTAEVAFRLQGASMESDERRILFASQYLDGEPRDAWFARESTMNVDTLTWEEFTQFLLNLIEDPVNRLLSDAQTLQDAYQRPNQTARAFDTFLSNIESRFTEQYTEEQRRMNYFTKLRPELRGALLNYQDLPATRQGIVELATRLENNQGNAGRKPRSRPHEGEQTYPNKRARLDDRSSPPPHRQGANRAPPMRPHAITCYNCQEKGHKAAECPKKDASQQGKA